MISAWAWSAVWAGKTAPDDSKRRVRLLGWPQWGQPDGPALGFEPLGQRWKTRDEASPARAPSSPSRRDPGSGRPGRRGGAAEASGTRLSVWCGRSAAAHRLVPGSSSALPTDSCSERCHRLRSMRGRRGHPRCPRGRSRRPRGNSRQRSVDMVHLFFDGSAKRWTNHPWPPPPVRMPALQPVPSASIQVSSTLSSSLPSAFWTVCPPS